MRYRFFEFEQNQTFSLVCWSSDNNGGLQAKRQLAKKRRIIQWLYGTRGVKMELVKSHWVWRSRKTGEIFWC